MVSWWTRFASSQWSQKVHPSRVCNSRKSPATCCDTQKLKYPSGMVNVMSHPAFRIIRALSAIQFLIILVISMFLLRSISLNLNRILSNTNATHLLSKRQADQLLSVTRHFFSLPSIFFRYKENFRMVTCINPAVIWVFLFHRCVQTSYWRTDCTWVLILTMRSSKIGSLYV